MKKAYKKPGLFLESFEMAEHIATCGINHTGDNKDFKFKAKFYADTCDAVLDFPGFSPMNIFMTAKCTDYVDESFLDGLGICYQGQQENSMQIFGS